MKRHLKKLISLSRNNMPLSRALVVVLVFILLLGFMAWQAAHPKNPPSQSGDLPSNTLRNSPEPDSQELIKESQALLGQSALTFPSVANLSIVAVDKIPKTSNLLFLGILRLPLLL